MLLLVLLLLLLLLLLLVLLVWLWHENGAGNVNLSWQKLTAQRDTTGASAACHRNKGNSFLDFLWSTCCTFQL